MFEVEKKLSNEGRLAIFLMHGVIENCRYSIRNYNKKHIMLNEFIAFIEKLSTVGVPLSMDDVLVFLRKKKPFPKKSFALTFDDGFENNLTIARPVLEKYGIPATLYVSTKFIDENALSWIDRIEIMFESVEVGELKLPWSDDVIIFGNKESKIEVLENIRKNAKFNKAINVDLLTQNIASQLSVKETMSSSDPLDKKMSWAQVRDWQSNGFLIGGHTHTHAIMSFLDPGQLEYEIETSINLIKKNTGISIVHYSYPEGMVHCYSQAVIDLLKIKKITCCPTAIEGFNPPGSDPFHLRRFFVV